LIIVNLKGGLGNQMFQYALAYVLAQRNDTTVAFDTRFLSEMNRKRPRGYVPRTPELNTLGIGLKPPTRQDLRRTLMVSDRHAVREPLARVLDRLGWCTVVERVRSFEPRVLERRDATLYLDGYWQSERYFAGRHGEIRRLFTTREITSRESPLPIMPPEVVGHAACVNVRRGDFIGSQEHDCLPSDYTAHAFNMLQERVGRPLRPYVFSDDFRWCERHVGLPNEPVFIPFFPEATSSASYLACMSQFRHFVIPNSTFGWWAAWLAAPEDKVVVAPRRWSGTLPADEVDIVPPDWLTV
jgi:hypothetical protein